MGFRVIGALKLASGLMLLAAGLGMFRLFKNDVTAEIDWAARHLKLDPDNHVFHMVLRWVSGLGRKDVRIIEAGTFFYALLHIVEGTGLILERDWAGYLTVIATSALVPFECYEVLQKATPPKILVLKVLVLVVNLGFVVYVVVKLRQEHREPQGTAAARRPDFRPAGFDHFLPLGLTDDPLRDAQSVPGQDPDRAALEARRFGPRPDRAGGGRREREQRRPRPDAAWAAPRDPSRSSAARSARTATTCCGATTTSTRSSSPPQAQPASS